MLRTMSWWGKEKQRRVRDSPILERKRSYCKSTKSKDGYLFCRGKLRVNEALLHLKHLGAKKTGKRGGRGGTGPSL